MVWRNGRRGSLSSCWPKGHVGSSPTTRFHVVGRQHPPFTLSIPQLTRHDLIILCGEWAGPLDPSISCCSMTWNEHTNDQGQSVGWYWYRETPGSSPYPVRIFDVVHLKYVRPLGDDPNHPRTVRLEQCSGEFLGRLGPPK